jgi:hypothetical protein
LQETKSCAADCGATITFEIRPGRQPEFCDPCKVQRAREQRRRWAQENRERHREARRRYKERNPEKYRESQQRYERENAEAQAQRRADWARRNPEKRAATKRRYRQADPERVRDLDRQAKLRVPASIAAERRRRYTIRRYGLTVAEYDEMLAHQDGGCAICHSEDPRGRNWSIDHCHETGRVRGLLCSLCNLGLGCFADKPERLLQAVAYLEAAHART